ncbi:hypothetical protein HL653_00365 [Sphingomonas sp. AP4-R1]|uniref:O-antigen ligase family protein n=1 Tax=Sphingomonas sp. AP4-R1 TaxID=2735134 RepID=UPI0014933A5A|nr:O-antigen ligase family protein [Sphingomonas sp. AP4-R1]QJU56440.1 hypothetical protein HL653_00365 [Sphingomonas sp. AP4-R1]
MLSVLSVALQGSVILFVSGNLFAFLLNRQDALWVRRRLLPIMIGFFAFAMLMPSKWIVYLALLAIIPAMARKRGDIPALYLVVATSLPDLDQPMVVGSLYLLNISKWLVAGIGAAIAYAMLPPVKNEEIGRRFDLPFVLFLALQVIQARGNNFTNTLRVETDVIASYLIPYFVISRSLGRPEDFRRLLLAMGFVGFTLSGIAIYEAKRTVLLYTTITHRLGIMETISAYSHSRGGVLRATASFADATAFGGFLCTALLCLLPARGAFRARKYQLFAFFVIFVGIYMANTRSALLGLVVGLLVYDLFRKNYRSLFRNVALIAAAAVAMVGIAQFSHSMATRIGIAGDAAETTDYRKLLITRGWEEIRKHPISGVNPGQAVLSLSDLKQGEGIVDFVNAYIWYGLTTGIIGMIAFLMGFLLPAIKMVGIRHRLNRIAYGREAGAVVAAVSIYYAVAAGTAGFGGRAVMIYFSILAVGAALSGARPPRRVFPAAGPTSIGRADTGSGSSTEGAMLTVAAK